MTRMIKIAVAAGALWMGGCAAVVSARSPNSPRSTWIREIRLQRVAMAG